MSRQTELLDISRSSLYAPSRIDPNDLATTAAIDRIFTAHPFYGSRKIREALKREDGIAICRDHVRRLMRLMGLHAIYPEKKPKTSQPHPDHRIYPYLLRGVAISHPDQVWGADITYIRLEQGFCYLVAVLDWFSRYVLAWAISPTLDADFCIDTMESALVAAHPEIVNTDQGSQFTSRDFTGLLEQHEVRISMDGRGRYADNIFTERLWRTVKYEEVYLKSYRNIGEAHENLSIFFSFYNDERPHQALDYQTPVEVYAANKKRPQRASSIACQIGGSLSTTTVYTNQTT